QEKIIGQPASYGCIRMKSSDITALYDRVPPGALVQIIPDRLPKTVQALPVQLTQTLVAATAAPQTQADNQSRHPKVAKAPRIQPTNSGIDVSALAGPPDHLTQNQPPAQDATESQDQRRPAKKGRSLTVEQMRMAGALAAERKKLKLASGKRLSPSVAATPPSSPAAKALNKQSLPRVDASRELFGLTIATVLKTVRSTKG